MGKILKIQPLRRLLAPQPVVAWASPAQWGLVVRQLPGVVRRRAELCRSTAEPEPRARAAEVALRARQLLGAAPVVPAMAAPVWAEQVALVPVVVAPEPAVEVLARVAVVLAEPWPVAAVPVARAAEVAT